MCILKFQFKKKWKVQQFYEDSEKSQSCPFMELYLAQLEIDQMKAMFMDMVCILVMITDHIQYCCVI